MKQLRTYVLTLRTSISNRTRKWIIPPLLVVLAINSVSAIDADLDGFESNRDMNDMKDMIHSMPKKGWDSSIWAGSYEQISSFNSSINSIEIGDINEDGFMDLALAMDGYDVILPGKKDGFTSTPIWISKDDSITADLSIGDINGDGYLDLVRTRYNAPVVAHLSNNGNLPIEPSWTDQSGGNMGTFVDLVDVDGDLDLDLLLGFDLQLDRLVLNENGTLSNEISWSSTDSIRTRAMAVADLDGDGDLELAIAHEDGPLRVYTMNARGEWNLSWSSEIKHHARDLAFVPKKTNEEIYLFAAISGITHGYRVDQKLGLAYDDKFHAPSSDTLAFSVVDLDGDGMLEIIEANAGGMSILEVRDEGLRMEWHSNDFPANDIELFDLGNDGDLDLIWASDERIMLMEQKPRYVERFIAASPVIIILGLTITMAFILHKRETNKLVKYTKTKEK